MSDPRPPDESGGNLYRRSVARYGHWRYVERAVIVLTVFGVWVYTTITANLLSIARHQFETSERPWVYPVSTIAGPLHIDAESLTVTLQFELKNVGHSPAVSTHIEPNIFLRRGFIHPLAEAKRVCTETRNRAWLPDQGFTLYPGDVGLPFLLTFSTQPSQMAEARQQGDHVTPFILPYIVGCIDYGFSFSPGHHQTAFIYQLAKTVPGRPPGSVAISIDDGDIPAQNLRLLLDPAEGTGPID
jgi:hypothetical protein